MTDRELMQQALDVLGHTIRTTYADARFDAVLVNNAITALRERLAQPEPAPGYCQHCKQYTIEEPLPAQPEQEPVPFVVRHYSADERPIIKGNGFDGLEVGADRDEAEQFVAWVNARTTTPPRREWVGLTEEEVDECYYWKGRQWTTDELVRHVEAKLKEKNA